MTTPSIHHHVVGPVHVLEFEDGDADGLAIALDYERKQCAAARVIIDLTGFDGAMHVVLDAAEKSGWGQKIMVRTADQRHLTLDELENDPNRTGS